MKERLLIWTSLLAVSVGAAAQSLVPGPPLLAISASMGEPVAGGSADSALFAEGMRAVRDNRWNEAVSAFERASSLNSDHADGALYWKAYAEQKLGKAHDALSTCHALRQKFPASHWLDECSALEIEVRAQFHETFVPSPDESDDVRLLALNSLMSQDAPRAYAQIERILTGDSSQMLQEGALYLLNQQKDPIRDPQNVRIRYLEGDVRVSRMERAGSRWEEATFGLALETGFTLATGKGRVEIEFEDASTLYLAENSLLLFADLHTTAGVPYSELALLTGTATMHIQPYVPGEQFLLKTPADKFQVQYPSKSHLRVTAYLDATAATGVNRKTLLRVDGEQQPMGAGQTAYFRDGHTTVAPQNLPADASAQFAAWDQWVEQRMERRAADTDEMMQASGLKKPIPGLADLRGQGHFFECAPYGNCWESNQRLANAESFPCLQPSAAPALWTVCHAGAWIERNQRYVWVAGNRRYHALPGQWIRAGRTVAFVPAHPSDEPGQPPINAKNAVFSLQKDSMEVERLDASLRLEFLREQPMNVPSPAQPALAEAEIPKLSIFALHDLAQGHAAGSPLVFNNVSQNFLYGKQVVQGTRSVTVMAPLNNRGGNLQARGDVPANSTFNPNTPPNNRGPIIGGHAPDPNPRQTASPRTAPTLPHSTAGRVTTHQ